MGLKTSFMICFFFNFAFLYLKLLKSVSISSTLSRNSNNLSTNSNSYSSSSSSSLITVIPNHRLKSNQQNQNTVIDDPPQPNPRPPQLPKSKPPSRSNKKLTTCDQNQHGTEEDKLDQLLVNFRRLCVDNHLNESLHFSMIEASPQLLYSSPNKQNCEHLDKMQLFQSIPILFHEAISSETSNGQVRNSFNPFYIQCFTGETFES